MRKLIIGLLACIPALAFAARNGAGTYSLPNYAGVENPVTSGQTIKSTWANGTLTDIGTELTNSLDRGGRGAMTNPLQCSNGAQSTPALTFASEVGSGLYWSTTNDIRMSVAGAWRQRWYGGTPATGGVQFNGTIGLVDPVLGSTAVTISSTASTSSYTLALPTAPPGSPLPLIMSTTGAVTPGQIVAAQVSPTAGITGSQLASNAGITGAQIANTTVAHTNLVALGQQASSDSGAYSNSSHGGVRTYVLSVSITTTGRPVVVAVVPTGTSCGANSGYGANQGAGTSQWYIDRDTNAATWTVATSQIAGGAMMYAQNMLVLDTGASAAAHTYRFSFQASAGVTVQIGCMTLFAYEL